MSTAVATMKKVQGIIPMGDLLELTRSHFIETEESLKKADSESVEIVELSDSVSVGEEKTKKKIKEKISESRFKKIRERMVAETLGIPLDELKAYRKDSAAFVDGSAPSNTEADILRDRRRVWRGQVGSNKRDKRDMVWTIMSGVITPILSQFPAVSALIAAIPGAQIAIIAAPLIAAFVVYKKGRKGNVADGVEKQRSYEEVYGPYMKKVAKLEEALNNHRKEIESQKKSLSKKEFKAWYKEFSGKLLKEIEAASVESQESQTE